MTARSRPNHVSHVLHDHATLSPPAAPGDTAAALGCSTTGPGTIPPESVTG